MEKNISFIRTLVLLARAKRELRLTFLMGHRVGVLCAEGMIMALITEAFDAAKLISV